MAHACVGLPPATARSLLSVMLDSSSDPTLASFSTVRHYSRTEWDVRYFPAPLSLSLSLSLSNELLYGDLVIRTRHPLSCFVALTPTTHGTLA